MRRNAIILYDTVRQMTLNGYGPDARTPRPGVQCRACKQIADTPEEVMHLYGKDEAQCSLEASTNQPARDLLVGYTRLCECGERHPLYGVFSWKCSNKN
jgi:hypothetical protein